jgi:6-hydroxytryprostatin B O-methyltransferase
MAQLKPQVRDAVLENITRTKHLVHDPSSFMTELLVQQQQYTCLHWLCHFDILTRIPLPPSAASYSDLAHKAQVPETTLRSAARMVITMGFLCETADGRLSHNALSAPFVENPHLQVWILYMVNQTVPVMRGMLRATEKYGDTNKPNETAYNVVMNTDMSFFEHLNSRPDLENEFDAYIKSQAMAHQGLSVEHLLQGFDWAFLGEGALVVDVGGGSGDASITVAKAHPKLRFVVQDQAVPVNNAKSKVAELHPDVSQRIQLQEHDFFTAQTVKDADVYLLRMIIHDWPDAEAVKILEQLVQVMKPGSRILIMDMIIPAPDSGSRTFEAALRQKDISMLQAFNAKGRETSDWYNLIQKVDSRLSIRAIRRPDGCQDSVIEVLFDETNGAASNGVASNGASGH